METTFILDYSEKELKEYLRDKAKERVKKKLKYQLDLKKLIN